MFKKANRLTQVEFSKYFKIGKKHNSQHLTIITSELDGYKTSVVVGKKVAKTAVKRNLLKRRAYALLRKLYEEKEFKMVVVVIMKPSFNTLSRKTAEEVLRQEVIKVIKSS
jgi:ribonuclease P protein component